LILEKYKKKKFAILIAARSDSVRLPGKHFKIINEKRKLSVLDYCIKRCRKSKIQNIILCTSSNKNDNIFEKYAKKNKIKVFRGSKNDVLKRYIDCCEKYNLSDIVRITGDCPLVDKDIINNLLNIYLKNNYDYVAMYVHQLFQMV
jgi:spore coat polysaccharide biosynthesis protein SpsF (cytidylyltransferase family)